MKQIVLKAMFLTTSCFLLLSCTSVKNQQNKTPNTTPISTVNPSPITSASCKLETCHGLDIKCGSNPPEACTMMYALGDRCLALATCGIQDGTCQQIENPKFTACKTCVEKCTKQYPQTDPNKLFDCERACPADVVPNHSEPDGGNSTDPSSSSQDSEAISLITNLPEVKAWLAQFPDGISPKTGGKPQIIIEGRNGSVYTVHAFEELEDHTASFNFFAVNIDTETVEKMF
jgi:hypothetical protein